MLITLKPEGLTPANPLFGADPQTFAYRLFAQDKLAQFAAIGLPQPHAERLVQMQWRGRNLTYAAQYPGAENWTVSLEDGAPIGCYSLQKTAQNVRIVDLAILPEWRGQGIGTHVLQQVAQQATAAGKTFSLRVEKQNPALRLYTRLGFAAVNEDETSYEMVLSTPGQ